MRPTYRRRAEKFRGWFGCRRVRRKSEAKPIYGRGVVAAVLGQGRCVGVSTRRIGTRQLCPHKIRGVSVQRSAHRPSKPRVPVRVRYAAPDPPAPSTAAGMKPSHLVVMSSGRKADSEFGGPGKFGTSHLITAPSKSPVYHPVGADAHIGPLRRAG